MKSRFFTDTQGLDACEPDPDTVCVCMRLGREAYERLVAAAARAGISCGAYLQRLIERETEKGP